MKTLLILLISILPITAYGVEYKAGRHPERTHSYAYHTRYNKPFRYVKPSATKHYSNHITPYSRIPFYTPRDSYGRPYGRYEGYGKKHIVFGYKF